MTCIEKTGRQIISTNFANIQKEFTNVKSAFGYFACNKHVILKCFLKVKIIKLHNVYQSGFPLKRVIAKLSSNWQFQLKLN